MSNNAELTRSRKAHTFCRVGEFEKAIAMIERSEVHVDNTDGWGRTFLMHAAEAGRMSICERLIELGADVLIVNKQTDHNAAQYVHPRRDGQLFHYLMSVTNSKLPQAANAAPVVSVPVPVAAPVAVISPAPDIQPMLPLKLVSPILTAAELKAISLARKREGTRAAEARVKLWRACKKNHPNEVREALAGKLVDIDTRNNRGRLTMLMIAAKNDSIDAVNILIEAGANLLLCSQEGKTALDYAVRSCRKPIAEAMEKVCKEKGIPMPPLMRSSHHKARQPRTVNTAASADPVLPTKHISAMSLVEATRKMGLTNDIHLRETILSNDALTIEVASRL